MIRSVSFIALEIRKLFLPMEQVEHRSKIFNVLVSVSHLRLVYSCLG